jgi:hypothetical protein
VADNFPPSVKLSADAQMACVFKFGITRKQGQRLADAGAWWVVPIGARREEIYGVRIVPGRALRESPIVRVVGGQVQTMVSRPERLMSWLIYPGTAISLTGWQDPLTRSDAAWKDLAKADAAFGGAGLDAIRALLADEKIGKAHLFSSGGDDLQPAVVEAMKRIDPSPETRAYYDYLVEIKDTDDWIAPHGKLGCWSSAAWDAAYASAETMKAEPHATEWAWQFWCGPHGFDCFQGFVTSVIVAPNGKSEIYVKAAQRLVQNAASKKWKSDPRWPAVEALAKDPKGYAGIAHMEASRALKKAGKPEEAFYALTSAAYWFGQNGGDERVELAEAAQLLAKEAGWKETLAALELAAERINGE